MALVRCREKHGHPKGRGGRVYVGYVLPIGYPETAVVCGRCDRPGVVWLDESDAEAFRQGRRVFEVGSNAVKVRVAEGEKRIRKTSED